MRTVMVTGTAGFIGFHLAKHLLAEGFRVVGYDGMTDYYDVRIPSALPLWIGAFICPNTASRADRHNITFF